MPDPRPDSDATPREELEYALMELAEAAPPAERAALTRAFSRYNATYRRRRRTSAAAMVEDALLEGLEIAAECDAREADGVAETSKVSTPVRR